MFNPELKLIETRCAGYGVTINKMIYEGYKIGNVANIKNVIGVDVKVLHENEESINEVKRFGLISDRQ